MPSLSPDDLRPRFFPKEINRQIHGLRGLAALMVFLFHVYGMGTLWGFWPQDWVSAFDWMRVWRHGVEVFFLISGYLITGSLIRHGDAGAFLVDRCIRIYPVFLAIQLLVFAAGPVVGYRWMAGIGAFEWLRRFVENALFLPGLFDLPLAQLNAWSLSYEAGFYLLAAAVFVAGRRLGRAPAGAALGAALVPLLALYSLASFLAAGALLYGLRRIAPKAVPALVRHLSPFLLAAMLALLVLGEDRDVFDYAAVLPGFLFFWSIVEGRCLLSQVLRWRALQYLGTISYSFYLWSPVATYPLKLVITRAWGPSFAAVLLFAAVGFALSLVLSHASYLVLEERAGGLLRKWAHGRGARMPQRADTSPEPGRSLIN